MTNLTSQLRKADGGPVVFRGHSIVAAYRVRAVHGESLVLRFESATSTPVQGLRLQVQATGAAFRLGGRALSDVVLWRDTAPDEVHITVDAPSGDAECVIWNVWKDTKHGTMLYGLNDAGMEVETAADGPIVIRCSDGYGAFDLSDLIVFIERSTSP